MEPFKRPPSDMSSHMVGEGGAGRQVLVFGESTDSFLDRAVADVGATPSVDHVVGIAVSGPLDTWRSRVADIAGNGRTGRILALDVAGEIQPWVEGPGGFDVRRMDSSSLGDLGVAVIESLKQTDAERPAVLVDSAAGLSRDPGKRFKFLTLLSHRLSKDDGLFLVFGGEAGIPDHEIATLERVFDTIERAEA